METPYILAETADFAAVWKPPRMHCAPLNPGEGGTLLDWYAGIFPPVREPAGAKKGEGGLVHRLDFETRGLVLFAKHQGALDFFRSLQKSGGLVKEYHARCVRPGASFRPAGFPPFPAAPVFEAGDFSSAPPVIESFFRPYGPGRKQVRPVTAARPGRETASDRGAYYRTGITAVSRTDNGYRFTLRISRGFRHQIRCHLAWAGFPIANDPLYGDPSQTEAPPAFLALRACALLFPDPRTGENREYRCE